LLADLNHTLDRRLSGQEASAPGILLVIDELARLAKMDCFEVLIAFLERCTEETRKANITFIGGSPKWTARHFKGRADIRGCMNAMLIHKTKPSQAELLLEDAHEKNLVKLLQQPGDAILATDYGVPTVVSVPLCTRQDMETIAQILGNAQTPTSATAPEPVVVSSPPTEDALANAGPEARSDEEDAAVELPIPLGEAQSSETPKRNTDADIVSLAQHRQNAYHPSPGVLAPAQLTVELIREQIQRRKAQDATLTQAEVARQVGMSQSYLSRILNAQCPLSDKHKQQLYNILFSNGKNAKMKQAQTVLQSLRLRSLATR
jgi:hypothetical protein